MSLQLHAYLPVLLQEVVYLLHVLVLLFGPQASPHPPESVRLGPLLQTTFAPEGGLHLTGSHDPKPPSARYG
ncbi:MAG: hypothetical protein A3E58_01980 [Candidatus Spechtbacteria bacterium RIFCSPHIGHO2_12_FULL_38_30]|nr:MAG: hypothetical protein A3E58_01980 [Candidatus Spechtbacteria bacterium RIFCSPHIGHO2_12_FULL_38_30]